MIRKRDGREEQMDICVIVHISTVKALLMYLISLAALLDQNEGFSTLLLSGFLKWSFLLLLESFFMTQVKVIVLLPEYRFSALDKLNCIAPPHTSSFPTYHFYQPLSSLASESKLHRSMLSLSSPALPRVLMFCLRL